MIVSSAFAGKSYAVLGLARSGLATVEALAASGARVMAWDGREEARASVMSSLAFAAEGDQPQAGGGAPGKDGGLPSAAPPPSFGRSPSPRNRGEDLVRIADPMTNALYGLNGVVVSPGVPLNTHPIAARAREAKVPVIGDIELFAQARASLPPHKVVGITGTNGKSTTTALIHHIVQSAGIPALLGGNIGLPILGQEPLPEGGVYVLELSSFQIDLTQSLDCDVAVLLNVTPDHLDRYKSFQAYVASKQRLFQMQSVGHRAIVGCKDPESRRIHDALHAERPQSVFGAMGQDLEDREFWELWDPDKPDFRDTPFTHQREWPSLQGPHNLENVAAAVAVAATLGVDRDTIVQALRSFCGLPHRMEVIAERNGVLFVNDSKATNPTSTAPALGAYPAVHWILGGRAKGSDLDACAPYFERVRAAYTIGEAGPMFAQLLKDQVPVSECGVLDRAVGEAAGAAKPGEVVLLSPACASFDQFRDYEARGEAFRAAVEALP